MTDEQVASVLQMFPDNETAEQWFIEKRWPNGEQCPHCGSDRVQRRGEGRSHNKNMQYRCRGKGCRKHFSVKVGTIMESSALGYQQWAIAIHLDGISSVRLSREIGITQKSAWLLLDKIRRETL